MSRGSFLMRFITLGGFLAPLLGCAEKVPPIGEATATGKQFVDAMHQRQWSHAYQLTAKEYQQKHSQDDLEHEFTSHISALGEFKDASNHFMVFKNSEGTRNQLAYRLKGSRRDLDLLVLVVTEGGKWCVADFEFPKTDG